MTTGKREEETRVDVGPLVRHRAQWLWRSALIGMTTLLTTVLPAGASPVAAASLYHGRGSVCNRGSVPILVTAKVGVDWRGMGGQWQVLSIGPGRCSDRGSQDVDVVWGRDCNSRNQCSLQAYKLGEGSFSVYNRLVSPIPPGRIQTIVGSGIGNGFTKTPDRGWPRPRMEQIGYTLRT